MKKIFIPINGQYSNIGDVMHRRVLLKLIGAENEIHMYIGDAPESFISAMSIECNNIFYYKSYATWYFKCVRTKNPIIVFKSGENRLGIKRLLAEITLLIVKIIKPSTKTIRIGISLNYAKIKYLKLFKYIYSCSDLLVWRNNKSKEITGIGEVAPDLGFYERKNVNETKKYIALSFRSDRKKLSKEYLNLLKEIALEKELDLILLTQVKKDNNRNEELSIELGCNHIRWDDEYDHLAQENRINNILEMSSAVISDRMHVLVKGVNYQAIPIGMIAGDNSKIKDHFDSIGIRNITINSTVTNPIEAKNYILDIIEKLELDKISSSVAIEIENLKTVLHVHL